MYRGADEGIEVLGIRRGREGLTHINFEDSGSVLRYTLPLTRDNTRSIDRSGGTMLHTSRTNPSKMTAMPSFLNRDSFPCNEGGWDLSMRVLENLERLELDSLVTIGGDDTLSYAATLNRLGVPVVAVPKTMDNDVRNTEYCIGFSTAITRAATQLSASARPSLLTNELAFFECSAATLDTPPSTRPIFHRSDA